MPEKRLQRTREAYEPKDISGELSDVELAAVQRMADFFNSEVVRRVYGPHPSDAGNDDPGYGAGV